MFTKSYACLLNTEPSNLVFPDQNDRPLEIKDKVDLTLLIN